MGTTREYGYREYADNLRPAKGGLSNLLFDENGLLSAHAPFHATERDEGPGSTSGGDEIVEALAVIGLLTLGYVTARGVRWAVRTIRAGLSGEKAATAATAKVEAAQASRVGADVGLESIAAAEVAREVDADECLILEVQALCEESGETLRLSRGVGAESHADRGDDGPRIQRPRRVRQARG